jgi:hypothetical protein
MSLVTQESFFLSVGWDDDPSQLLQSRRSQVSWIDHMLQKLLSSAGSKSSKSIPRKQIHSPLLLPKQENGYVPLLSAQARCGFFFSWRKLRQKEKLNIKNSKK